MNKDHIIYKPGDVISIADSTVVTTKADVEATYGGTWKFYETDGVQALWNGTNKTAYSSDYIDFSPSNNAGTKKAFWVRNDSTTGKTNASEINLNTNCSFSYMYIVKNHLYFSFMWEAGTDVSFSGNNRILMVCNDSNLFPKKTYLSVIGFFSSLWESSVFLPLFFGKYYSNTDGSIGLDSNGNPNVTVGSLGVFFIYVGDYEIRNHNFVQTLQPLANSTNSWVKVS